jgi:hypothetical protein
LPVQQPSFFAGSATEVIQPIFAPICATPLAQPHTRSSLAPLMTYAPNLGSVPVYPPNSPPSSTSQIEATNAPNEPTDAPINPTNALPPPHPMLTRSRNNISKPRVFSDGITGYSLPRALLVDGACDSLATKPTCFSQAIKHPHWHDAMNSEFDALLHNRTWSLVPTATARNIIGCKWVFLHQAAC